MAERRVKRRGAAVSMMEGAQRADYNAAMPAIFDTWCMSCAKRQRVARR